MLDQGYSIRTYQILFRVLPSKVSTVGGEQDNQVVVVGDPMYVEMEAALGYYQRW